MDDGKDDVSRFLRLGLAIAATAAGSMIHFAGRADLSFAAVVSVDDVGLSQC